MGFRKITVSLAEIAKRLPENQMKQFEEFTKRYNNYMRKMNKNPEKLPVINWENYRGLVSAKTLPMIDEWEKKYAELNKLFDSRDELDHCKYYEELDKQEEETCRDIEKFKEESEKRILKHEAELKRLKELKPYDQMTIEEFCILQPEKAKYVPYYGNNELFWPFEPEDQLGAKNLQSAHAPEIEKKENTTKPQSSKLEKALQETSKKEAKGAEKSAKVTEKSAKVTEKSEKATEKSTEKEPKKPDPKKTDK